MLWSYLEYPICDCIHSFSISPCWTPFDLKHELSSEKKHWTARNLQKLFAHRDRLTRCPLLCSSTRSRPCTRVLAPCPNFRVRTWKKGVFTLVPSDYRTRAPCSGTKCKLCLICFRMPSSFNGTRTGSARKETSSTVHGCRMFLWIFSIWYFAYKHNATKSGRSTYRAEAFSLELSHLASRNPKYLSFLKRNIF